MSLKKKTLVFTATFNEADNIEKLIVEINKQPVKVDILIIDDNSPDKTYEIIEKLQKKNSNIFLIKREKKSGLDTAHKLSYEFALKNDYDNLITMDADLSHDPSLLNKFVEHLNSYQFVIGSRYAPGGKCFMKGRRLILSKYGNLIMRLVLNIECSEFTTSYRGYNLKNLNNFHLNQVQNNGYSFFMGTIYEIFQRKFTVKEIPIIFKDRVKGYSKIPRIEIIRTLINLIKVKLRNNKN
jgi:glycosyltransferase involved in cell wall biosynthesis